MEVEEKKDSTIVRTLVNFLAGPTAGLTSLEAAWGISFINSDAHAALAFPDPEQNFTEDTDWMWLEPHVEHLRGDLASGTAGIRVKEDLRSKRKYNDRNQLLVFTITNVSAVQALFVQGYIRVLILRAP